MNLDPEITPEELKVFLAETEEQIELLDEDIVKLEKEEGNPDLLQEIFRAAHTIKGSSAMVGHQPMAELTHAMESLLDKLRNRELSVNTEIIDTLLNSLDALKILKEEIASSEDSNLDIVPVIARLKEATGEDIGPVAVKEEAVLSLDQDARERLETALAEGQKVYRIRVSIDKKSDWAAIRCLQILNDLARMGEVIGAAPSAKDIEEEKVGFELELILASAEDEDTIQGAITSIAEIDDVKVTLYDSEESAAVSQELTSAQPRATDQSPETTDRSRQGTGQVTRKQSHQTFQSVRIDVKVLDNLMNIVEELVIDRSKISRVNKVLESRYADDEWVHELGQTAEHLIKVITELQENIMQVRMVPIGTVFGRFSRMVRDLAQTQKKKIDFIVEGEETELDRSLIEQIRDPLIHLLRNAIDHGVESPEKRQAANKPETAVVRLTAEREQSHIVITVTDDGNGIDVNKIRDSAMKRGLISAEAAESLTEAETINLIFMAGMSTAEKTTEVSGRGVGLDIVRANVENLSGSVILDTVVGQGSKFTIRLPLTVAIIQGLMVSSAGVVYALPLASVVAVMTVEPWEIQTIKKKELIRHRETLIPLLRLNTTFDNKVMETENHHKDLIVVVKAGDRLLGVVVDSLMERQEIVVKSLGKYLGDIEGIAGATILGDGQVSLILDLTSLAKMSMSRVTDNRRQEPHAVATVSPTAA